MALTRLCFNRKTFVFAIVWAISFSHFSAVAFDSNQPEMATPADSYVQSATRAVPVKRGGSSRTPTPRVGENKHDINPSNLSTLSADYLEDLWHRIERAWIPPKGLGTKSTTLIFHIHGGGELSDLLLDHSSGIALVDQSAFKAVEIAAPFRPLPRGISDTINAEAVFELGTPNSVRCSFRQH